MRKESFRDLSHITDYDERLTLVAPILGGILEVGGGVRFSIGTTRKNLVGLGIKEYRYAYPLIEVGDNDPKKAARLKKVLGGTSANDVDNSWQWVIVGGNAYKIAVAIESYAPSRSLVINGFRTWERLSVRNRLVFATEFNDLDKAVGSVSVQDYEIKVQDPLFLTGVYLGRGALLDNNDKKLQSMPGDGSIHISFNTINRPLLDAMQAVYKGGCWAESRYESLEQSQRSWIKGQIPSRLNLAEGSAIRFYSVIEPYLNWFLYS